MGELLPSGDGHLRLRLIGALGLSLIIGVVLSLETAYTLPVYFPDTRTLFPVWPVIDPIKALYLFVATIVVLLLPKVLGLSFGALAARSSISPRRSLYSFSRERLWRSCCQF